MTTVNTVAPDMLCPCGSGVQHANCCGEPNKCASRAAVLARITKDSIVNSEKLTATLRASLETMNATPDLFPARINFFDNRNYFVKMSPRWYRESVFLDPNRILGTCVIESDNEHLQTISDQIGWQSTNFIFHTAFCGSTLISQALNILYDSLPIREPEILGNILFYLRSDKVSNDDKIAWLDRVLRLLSRRYETQQQVVVKTNDHSNALMLDVLKSQHRVPILFMYTPLNEFVIACLKAKSRRQWIQARCQSIAKFVPDILVNYTDKSLQEYTCGEMAAIYWSYNIALYHQAWKVSHTLVRSLNFNSVLANPSQAIEVCAQYFELKPRKNIDVKHEVDMLFGVYSKNSKITYSPEQRQLEIEELCDEYTTDINSAEQLARKLLLTMYPEPELPGHLL